MGNKDFSFGYHCSHEQFKPSHLLNLVQQAEQAGFGNALSSDHFYPWSENQGESGYAWSWLGAAMQATSLPFGVVSAPGQRYHPAIAAQKVATLCEMFPHRFFIAAGSGQFLNERITGQKWPGKQDRNDRLKLCVDIMRALWRGETVTHKGLVEVEYAKLYTLPDYIPPVFGAAITPETAEWVGSWADGLITISNSPDKLKEVVEAFHKGGGEGKPMHLKVQLSYDTTKEKARQGAHEQWKNNVFPSALLSDIPTVKGFDAAGSMVKPDELEPAVRISDSAQEHVDWLAKDMELGFTHLHLHNVNLQQEQYIAFFGERVLPELQKIAERV
ncbi:TIGR03885 family FMN-dependent LLM class oxidoreductase [Rufibacter hautae]|uniref:TIGR03885 family FMN-dependent LLM class oxidoreductase n=1 Tax=Rufibacter hautae TaxID=2595005 RepID=A0A5B6TE63_9BACT|nr:TIGR03885 family FMN-dependent LLM class oxidoreductase [Rufibacter hautae]KAA3437575.1 TIGR03885 family FMN-dependent LLM class oxidoreductase [Rufibacter hautae]